MSIESSLNIARELYFHIFSDVFSYITKGQGFEIFHGNNAQRSKGRENFATKK